MEKITIDSSGGCRRKKKENRRQKEKYNLGARENSSASCEQRFFPSTIAIPYHAIPNHPMPG